MYCIACLKEEDKKLNPLFNEILRSFDGQESIVCSLVVTIIKPYKEIPTQWSADPR
jgi:hypothetical protein